MKKTNYMYYILKANTNLAIINEKPNQISNKFYFIYIKCIKALIL